jgi:FtsP/CotA-like multicopper oxidase with cupredoxin domain
VATAAWGEVWPDRRADLLTFGGSYPSPTIHLRRGDVFTTRLENRLGAPTNVHWHGLSVPAAMDGHPSNLVAPGGSRDYAFQVLDRAGTYWYHPHPHGHTAEQVYRGMAGFLLIEDEAERGLGLPAGEQDVPLLIQDRRQGFGGSLTYAPTPRDLMAGYLGDAVLVNGEPGAVLDVAPALYRLRLLNGSNARVFRLGFEDGRRFHVIGGDGGLLERPIATDALFLGPAERAELLVDFSGDAADRQVRLLSLPFVAAGRDGPGMGMGGSLAQGVALQVLSVRVTRSDARRRELPTTLGPVERFVAERAEVRRRFVMEMRMPPFVGSFLINGLSYEADRIDVRVERGPLEIWEIVNASNEPHPFHVHATQFQVLERSSGPLGPHERGFKDTVLVWGGETVRIAIRFEHHAGLYVLHCHNLEHEDAGMMLNLELL